MEEMRFVATAAHKLTACATFTTDHLMLSKTRRAITIFRVRWALLRARKICGPPPIQQVSPPLRGRSLHAWPARKPFDWVV